MNYKLDQEKYIGNHSDGRNTIHHSDVEKFIADSGANDDQVYAAFNMEKGQVVSVNGKKYECIKHSLGKSNGFTRHEIVIIKAA